MENQSKNPFKLTSREFLKELEELLFLPNIKLSGKVSGEHSSCRRGSSQEFKDFRSYTHGDDLRFLDWNLYARFRKPFIKLFHSEEEIDVYIFLDLSSSMGWGDPPKIETSLRVAAAIFFLVLTQGDRAGIFAYHPDKNIIISPQRGRSLLLPVLKKLENIYTKGKLTPSKDLRAFFSNIKQKSFILFISDLLFDEGADKAVRLLTASKHPAIIIQVLHPQELNPEIDGNVTLIDPESGEKCELSIDNAVCDRYKALFKSWNDNLVSSCMRHGVGYVRTEVGEPLKQIIGKIISNRCWQISGKTK